MVALAPCFPASKTGALLEIPPPLLGQAQAEAIAQAHWGIEARAVVLSAERDRNFRLTGTAGTVLLKVSNHAEDAQAVAAQTEALVHIAARDPALPVPRVLAMRDGHRILRWQGAEEVLLVRLLSYLPGTPLARAPRSAAQRRAIGAALARLTLALRGFVHPGAERPLLWDVSRAGELVGLLDHIGDAQARALAGRFLHAFEQFAAPVLPRLRAQVLHNDFNPHNLLMDVEVPEQVAGIIDFGDMVRAPLVNDVAIAAAYDVPADGHPLAHAAELVAAYHAVHPLLPEELLVLFDLIAARQAASVVIATWRAGCQPENRDYILRNSAASWHGLRRFATLGRAEAQAFLRAACGMEAAA